MRAKTISLIQVNVAVLIWGGTAMFAKGIGLPVTPTICGRSLTGTVALLAYLLIRKKPFSIKTLRHCGVMLLLGLLLCAHWLTYFKALKVSSAAVAILALHTYPVLTALVEPFLFKEKLRGADVIFVAIVLAGIVIMMPEVSLADTTTQGILIGFVSGLFFMARNLAMRVYLKEYSSSALMFWQMLVTGIVLVPWVVSESADYSGNTVPLLVLLGVVFTSVPHTLFASALENLSAKTVGILATLLPLYGAILGYLMYDEKVTPRTALGGSIVLACVVVETAKNAKDGEKSENT